MNGSPANTGTAISEPVFGINSDSREVNLGQISGSSPKQLLEINRSKVHNRVLQSNNGDESSSEDSEFEDLETPKIIRNSHRNDSINNSGIFSIKSTTIKVPLNSSAKKGKQPSTPHNNKKNTKTASSPVSNRFNGSGVLKDREDSLIRENKLISDDNQFSPNLKGRSGLLKSTENSSSKIIGDHPMPSPGRTKIKRFDFEKLKEKNVSKKGDEHKPMRKEDPVIRLFQAPVVGMVNGGNNDVDEDDGEFGSSDNQEDPDKLSMKPQVDNFTIRTASPKLDKIDDIVINQANTNNIASSLETDSVLTGVLGKRSLQDGTSRVDFDLSNNKPLSHLNHTISVITERNDNISKNIKMDLDRELSSDEHEVSMDENSSALLNELNSYSFIPKFQSPAKPSAPSISAGPKSKTRLTSSRVSTPKFGTRMGRLPRVNRNQNQSPNPQVGKFTTSGSSTNHSNKQFKPEMTPIRKHYDRLENKYAKHIMNKRRNSAMEPEPEVEEESITHNRLPKPSQLNKPWPEEKWEKLNQLLKSPTLTVEDILNSDTVQDKLDISKSDLEERIKFLVKFNEFKESRNQKDSRKRRKLL
ncbi:hypothetical protein PSN45_000616 [Yamadazyma tenuis]|uniref:Uncharacterized protein n=1 Tax=Candida tenuis (strain ATCC 10573 / BCRC 21748 / CBS 615 / JCM 9827 / NBRC 10315 / NRRL Y-1498 / VKM Y-70) TaxID=590646 RepID=G3B9L6_CANTC|nr:uncharacterized protein CANTEDRAFT_94797 [Yamadazyma tenuis ATCC 10573]EGV61923.1 hypothetical protein CANTEDRAFT_94797 [Yamadazyma tenuis ATCC 10573]WEJ93155.1 hypothetical protein PSN45_000616 [Yamadazyma tenuis]